MRTKTPGIKMPKQKKPKAVKMAKAPKTRDLPTGDPAKKMRVLKGKGIF